MTQNLERNYAERSFGEVFNIPNVEYEIPFFQRGYVWDNEKWKELLEEVVLESICEVSDPSIRSDLEKIKDTKEEEIKSANYYFGTIYLKEKTNTRPAGPGTPTHLFHKLGAGVTSEKENSKYLCQPRRPCSIATRAIE